MYFGPTHQRGVAIYCKQGITANQVEFEEDFSEYVTCTIKLRNNDTLLLCSLYRSPNNKEHNNDGLIRLLSTIESHPSSHKLITRDFNYKEIDWANIVSTVGANHPATKFWKPPWIISGINTSSNQLDSANIRTHQY